ncbi:hypothetical protein BD410DRAFT_495075 [Rickenella mellea]|uniref:Uncharacterized protein n=1 Tax=Rickenella mellea TaxID=50990 RepID=A0A4Y7PSS6_9AGAM|nr:hypothetical protein BD410DRAFT_495075 [Rickenella mellea]
MPVCLPYHYTRSTEVTNEGKIANTSTSNSHPIHIYRSAFSLSHKHMPCTTSTIMPRDNSMGRCTRCEGRSKTNDSIWNDGFSEINRFSHPRDYCGRRAESPLHHIIHLCLQVVGDASKWLFLSIYFLRTVNANAFYPNLPWFESLEQANISIPTRERVLSSAAKTSVRSRRRIYL